MHYRAPAELRFPDDGTVATGIVARTCRHTVTVRIEEQSGSDLFAYGRAGVLVHPCAAGVVCTSCRLVAQYDAGRYRDIVVALTGDPETCERRRYPRLKCHLNAVYRAAHKGSSRGAWGSATVIDISQEGIGLLIPGHPSLPETMEIRVNMPETLLRIRGFDLRPVAVIRNGAPIPAECCRPIRMRADLRRQYPNGDDTVAGLQLQPLSPWEEEKLKDLLAHLADSGRPDPDAIKKVPVKEFISALTEV